MPIATLPGRKRGLFFGLALALGYVLTGKLALTLALPPGYASAIFPPAGIAVAAAFIAGRRPLGWIFLGSALLNIWVGIASGRSFGTTAVLISLSIAGGSTVQAAAGGWLLRRTVGFPTAFDKASDVLASLFLAPVICVVSASISVGCLALLGAVPAGEFWLSWFTWWTGDTLGVIVALPIALAFAGEPRSQWRRRAVTVALPMLAALGVIVAAYVRASAWEFDDSLGEFRAQSQSLKGLLQTRFEEQELLLGAVAAFMAHDPDHPITPAQFRRFCARTLPSYPMLQAIEWAPRVDQAQRAAFESRQQARFPGLHIFELSADGQRRVAQVRAQYYPVTLVEPLASNAAAAGFDIASNLERRQALMGALARGGPVASAPVRLTQETGEQSGILLMMGAEETAGNTGVVVTVLRVGDFIEYGLPRDRSGFGLRILDVEADRVIYGPPDAMDPKTAIREPLRLGGRLYRLEMAPSAAYLARHRGWQSWSALGVALFGTGLLGALLLLGSGVKYRREIEDRLALSLAGSELATTDWDLARNRLLFGSGWHRLLGYEAADLAPVPQTLVRIVHPDDLAQARARLVRHLKRDAPLMEAEVRMRHKDGRWIWVLVVATAVVRDDAGWALRMSGTARNISERKSLEQSLQAKSAEIEDLYDRAPCGYHSLDAEGTILHINSTELDWIGCTREEVVGKMRFVDFLTPEGRERFRASFPLFKSKGSIQDLEIDLAGPPGTTRRVSASSTAVRDEAGNFLMSRTVLFDITELTRVKTDLRRLASEQAAMLDNDLVGIARLRGRTVTWANRALHRIFGYGPGELIGKSTRIFYPDDASFDARGAEVYPMLRAGDTVREQSERLRKDGTPIWVDVSGMILAADPDETLWMFADITPLREQQERIAHMAYHDLLTGLPNRRLLDDRLSQAIAAAGRSGTRLAVCYLDLDGFKPVNDRYGHSAGDVLLRTIAARLLAGVRHNDTVCRIGGDEFVIVMTGLADYREFEVVAARLLDELARPCDIGGLDLARVSASIGAVLYPDDATDRLGLLRCADLAMYRAKAQGRNRICRFTPDLEGMGT